VKNTQGHPSAPASRTNFDALTLDEAKLVDEIISDLRKAVRDASLRFGTRIVRHGGKILRGRRVGMKGFEERLYGRWAIPLDLYELCLYIALNCGRYFSRHFRPGSATITDHKFKALLRLHAGATRVAGEVYALLLAGFPSGAHARWRTLHEIAVTALFIAQEDNETAERYINHRFVKSYEDAREYQKYAFMLGEEPFTDEEMTRIKQNYESMLVRYGADFHWPYAWAHPALLRRDPQLKGNKIGFQHLQAAVEIQHWTPRHRMASHAVHPSATFARFNLGSREDKHEVLPGASNADLADPGQNALFSLTNATAALVIFEPGSDDITEHLQHRGALGAMAKALSTLSKIASEEFMKVHLQLEDEIRAEGSNANS